MTQSALIRFLAVLAAFFACSAVASFLFSLDASSPNLFFYPGALFYLLLAACLLLSSSSSIDFSNPLRGAGELAAGILLGSITSVAYAFSLKNSTSPFDPLFLFDIWGAHLVFMVSVAVAVLAAVLFFKNDLTDSGLAFAATALALSPSLAFLPLALSQREFLLFIGVFVGGNLLGAFLQALLISATKRIWAVLGFIAASVAVQSMVSLPVFQTSFFKNGIVFFMGYERSAADFASPLLMAAYALACVAVIHFWKLDAGFNLTRNQGPPLQNPAS